ncbi:MAG: hypothetical protein JNK59_10830 [Sterolibacteriaceae bacterium]|uniref:hypothetical protein n=1 Tax=Sulfuritalea sp. TaxID=2480090 RepID=UPI001A456CFB|nr:hypothetical protein [Sulfuritalea sp.]MBL8479792.1 hypothetical protein [Sterolibacteriaceae bacterium]MBN8477159.1 hypothetical protein [Sulfuritalea sp.]
MKSGRILEWLAIAAIAFGVLTVFSGGRALFGGMEARAGLGNIVPFVLWFNFLAGFVYVLAGAALLLAKPRAAPLALFLAVSTILVFLAFAVHIAAGGAFEARTAGAMSLRSLFWIAVAFVALRAKKAPAVVSNPR